MSRTTVDRIVLAGFVVLAVLLYISTASYPGIAQKTSAKYVRFLSLCLGGLGAIQLGLSLWKEKPTVPLALTGHVPRFVGLIAGLIAFAIAFDTLGFFIPAAAFIPVISLMLGQRNPIVIAGTTLGLLVVVYLIFVVVLGIRLPGPQF
ncbi:tripartite tricarboxylate transporter TctB family protein [Thioclava sp.]|uniref:tripartite tricarboxylate transporter TctB family protein n=1 Tax=Thioclava sp. TaxID=1933450 RepID=UPI003AA8921A